MAWYGDPVQSLGNASSSPELKSRCQKMGFILRWGSPPPTQVPLWSWDSSSSPQATSCRLIPQGRRPSFSRMSNTGPEPGRATIPWNGRPLLASSHQGSSQKLAGWQSGNGSPSQTPWAKDSWWVGPQRKSGVLLCQKKNGGLLAKTSQSFLEDSVKAGVVTYESWGPSPLGSCFECLNTEEK